jgi:SAM-dependent methyltransferase
VENRVVERFGREIARLSERSQRRWLGRAVAYWRSRGFPYPELSQSQIEADVTSLRRLEPEAILVDSRAMASTVGLRLANAYHPQIWEIPRHGRSAVDCFLDDRRLRDALKKSARFYPNRRCWNAQCLRSVLRFQHRSRVSNFRPAVARALYQRFSPEGGRLLDFAAGFGGRLLGALTLSRHYVGIDPAVRQVEGLRRMVVDLARLTIGTAEIVSGCAEDLLPLLPGRAYDAILSSPPYFNTEEYESSPQQSCYRFASYADWREGFLTPVIEHGCRLLRPGGFFLLNVKDQPGRPIASDARRIFPRSYKRGITLKLLVPALPHLRANHSCVYLWEPILVMRRPHRT